MEQELLSTDTIKKRRGPKGKPVYQFTLEGEFIREYKSVKEAVSLTSVIAISGALRGKHMTAGGYIWLYTNDAEKAAKVGAQHKIAIEDRTRKLVNYNTGNVRSEETLDKLKKSMIEHNSSPDIRASKRDKMKAHHKADSGEWKKNIIKACVKAQSIEVIQYSLTGEELKRFPSTAEAARQLSLSPSCIWRVCNGKRKTAGGYKWKHPENITTKNK